MTVGELIEILLTFDENAIVADTTITIESDDYDDYTFETGK